jgi:type II secretory pathway pseudopilin PulG
LIFVIVIIGILAATALPKFSGVRDKAKVNSELSAMNSLDGAITAAVEFRIEDFNDRNVDWHNNGKGASVDAFNTKQATYKAVNDANKVLSKIAKKTEKLKIVGVLAAEDSTVYTTGQGAHANANDILFIIGDASNPDTGVSSDSELNGKDSVGKPDKNDIWVFNPNNFDLNITSTDAMYTSPTVIVAQSIGLVDMNDTTRFDVTHLRVINSDGNANGSGVKTPATVQY